MTIIASCGHELSEDEGPFGMGFEMSVASYSRDWQPFISIGSYCKACAETMRKTYSGLLPNDEAEEF